ncbi:RTA1 like protein-domain-containing protein [Mycena maculata]|uniref:RTA1 like protein-domain-containing protein n=1 Tax=Mycena maculata TaxID=230809 RepID=A0AAD7NYS0_9AGAR|nr:RTA1 like protein-domain-containing protein [Mycena maculata]
MSRLFSAFILFACFATGLAADATNTTADASDKPIAPAYIAMILFAICGLIHWIHFFTVKPIRPFMLSLTLGMTAMTTGFALRVVYTYPPFTIGKYIAWDLFILLSPCLFLAANYTLLAHLAATFDKEVTDRCLLIRSSRIVKLFVWSDVTTFFLQSSGGGLTATKNNPSIANIGNKIVMIGLILQAVSYLLFTCVLIVFGWRVSAHFPAAWRPQNPRPFKLLSRQPIDDWRIVFYIMCTTCVGILVRSVFRIAEFGEGYSGVIATHEGYFYVFDSLPLWLAMTLYCVVWPARALNVHSGQMELQSTSRTALKAYI